MPIKCNRQAAGVTCAKSIARVRNEMDGQKGSGNRVARRYFGWFFTLVKFGLLSKNEGLDTSDFGFIESVVTLLRNSQTWMLWTDFVARKQCSAMKLLNLHHSFPMVPSFVQ